MIATVVTSPAEAQWTIAMRVMRNPLPLGECAYVEIVVTDAQGRQGPLRPDGKQVSGWDFDFTVSSSVPNAFALQNDDPTRPFICARAPTAPSATFTAHYPGRQLRPNQIVPEVELWKTVEVMLDGYGAVAAGAPGYAAGQPSGAANPSAGYPAGTAPGSGYPAAGAPATGYPQPDPAYGGYAPAGAAPGAGYPPGYGATAPNAPPNYPAGDPQAGGYAPAGGYPPAGGYAPAGAAPAGGYPQGDPSQAAGYPPSAGYPQGAGYPQAPAAPQAGAAQAGSAAAGTAPAPDPGVRTGKQFLQRITGHAKRKASEVATNTTTHVADAAGDVVGTTLEAGSDVVKSGTGAVTGAASQGVQGVGRSLGAPPSRKDPTDVAAALAQGRAVLFGLRFTEGTAMLEPSSGPLISQIAGALVRTPGQFLIEAHVDGKNAVAALALSEQRAAAVKAALVAAGTSPMQLAAVGYGATRPIPEAKSSARIEIARTQ